MNWILAQLCPVLVKTAALALPQVNRIPEKHLFPQLPPRKIIYKTEVHLELTHNDVIYRIKKPTTKLQTGFIY